MRSFLTENIWRKYFGLNFSYFKFPINAQKIKYKKENEKKTSFLEALQKCGKGLYVFTMHFFKNFGLNHCKSSVKIATKVFHLQIGRNIKLYSNTIHYTSHLPVTLLEERHDMITDEIVGGH